MTQKFLLSLALLATAAAAQAQTPPSATPAAPAAALASSPAKKELAARIVRLQQPAIEALARSLAEQPVRVLMDRVPMLLSTRVPAERRDAVATEIQGDVRKYLEEAVPVVRDRAIQLAPLTIGAMLEERFTEEELTQLVAQLESPTYRKFQQLGDALQKSLVDRTVAETRPSIEPKVQALDRSLARRLGLTPPQAPAANQPPPPALGPRLPAAGASAPRAAAPASAAASRPARPASQ